MIQEEKLCREEVATRQEHLFKFAAFCRALGKAVQGAGFDEAQSAAIFHLAVFAECVNCGIFISGDELFELSQAAAGNTDLPPKLRRLLLGDCPRSGCNAYYYRVQFRYHAEVDWPTLLEVADELRAQEESKAADAPARCPRFLESLKSASVRRGAAAFGLIVGLLLLRQWYIGGTIPLIREPEHFRVDPLPVESVPEQTRED